VGNGNYFIQNEASHLVLDNSLSTSDGTPIDQFQSYGGPNQQWQVEQQPNGTDVIVKAYSQKALEDPETGNDENGIQMEQSQFNGGANQQWTLVAAGDGNAFADYLQNAYYGNQIYFGSPSYPALFNFVPLADGNDLIVTTNDGPALVQDVEDGQPVLNNLDFQLSQQWYIAPQGNATVAIQNAENYMVFDENAGPDGPLGLDQWYGGLTQEFYLTPAPAGVDIHGQPSNAVVGQPISPAITVAVVDAKGNTITTNNTQLVTLSIASGPKGAQLLGTTTVRAVDGVADFTNLTLSLAGTYTLTATGGALTPDFSNVFTVAPVNVTSAVTIHRGSMHKIGRAKASRNGAELVAQTITIKNASRQPLDGPLALRVGGLPSGVTLANATGTYEGGSYRDVLAALQPLAPGKSVTVTLDFSMSGRRSPSLSNLDEDLEALLGI
jgi:hypothetical protein